MAPKRPKRSKRRKQKSGRTPQAVESCHALPTCEGPKLERFKNGNAAIEFVSLLSAETPGADGSVFEVVIGSKHYALKMASYTSA